MKFSHLVTKNSKIVDFLYEMLLVFGGKVFRGRLFKFCDKIVVRGNSVQKISNFPAKSLSI